LKNTKKATIIEFLGKYRAIKNLIRKVPILGQVYLEKDQLLADQNQLKTIIAQLQAECNQLQTIVAQLRTERNQLQIIVEQTQEKILQLQSKLDQMSTEHKSFQKEIDRLQMERKKYKNWVDYLLKEKRYKISHNQNKDHNIAVIINYCTNDYKFFKPCIKEVKKFSQNIIVPIADFFFDGTPENQELLKKTYNESVGIKFIKFEFDPNRNTSNPQYWITFSRWVGFNELKEDEDIEYILFLDIDEIIEGDKFVDWLNNFNYRDYDAILFKSYWYFKEAKFRALTTENQGLLVKKDKITKDLIINIWDRDGIFIHLEGNKIFDVTGLDDEPMVHHYSWVRTKEEMLKKVQTWGHRNDRDWKKLIEEEFAKEFTEDSTDFVHGYKFKVVKPYIDI